MIVNRFVLQGDDGWPIRGDVRRHETGGQEGLVVVSHGFKGFRTWGFFPHVAEHLADNGFTAVTFDFSGNGIGEVEGELTEVDRFNRNTLSREVSDLSRVLTHALSNELPGLPESFVRGPALLGHSRGGLVSLVVASRFSEVRAVVNWAGVGSLEARYDKRTREDWRREGFLEIVNTRTGQVFQVTTHALEDMERNWDAYDPMRVVPRLSIPVLLVHGGRDPTIPLEEARQLAAASPDRVKLLILNGAGHTLDCVHPFGGPTPALQSALSATVNFLRSTVIV